MRKAAGFAALSLQSLAGTWIVGIRGQRTEPGADFGEGHHGSTLEHGEQEAEETTVVGRNGTGRRVSINGSSSLI